MRTTQGLVWAAVALALALATACGTQAGGGDADESLDRFVPEAAETRGEPLAVPAIEQIDVLFVVDDSTSMREEQAALRVQLPRILGALVTGDIDADGEPEFAGVSDLHVGVVSSELGIGSEGVEKCMGAGGDGILQHEARDPALECRADLPTFLSYEAAGGDLDALAQDFACMAALGTDGCGFEQPLEAALKALWPASDERIEFLAVGSGSPRGHGDAENAGFARGAADGGPSLLIVVAMTDEDDCSAWNQGIFLPSDYLPAGDPRAEQPINLRCYHNPGGLYPLERYARGLRLLREGAEQLVMFAVIGGIPPELVSAERIAEVDYADAAARDAYYTELLGDPRMQEQIDPESTTTAGGGNQTPSCATESTRAYPPRRLIGLARELGENGIVQSLCQDDFGPAVGVILERIAHRMQHPMAAPE